MNAIVTTTINGKTEALEKFSQQPGWTLIVVGDQKTPDREHQGDWCIYLDTDTQNKFAPKLSKLLGWNTIQRRNIGFLYAYCMGAELIATVDDDNIPNDGWHWRCHNCLGKTKDAITLSNKSICGDPLCYVTNTFWHRGYPLHLLNSRQEYNVSFKDIEPLVQVGFWDGDPDIDAIQRINNLGKINYTTGVMEPFVFSNYSPFNSQNTVLKREALPYYCCLPGIGRMDDIWGAYLLEKELGFEKVVYSGITVRQKRNEQDVLQNMNDEWFGYKFTYRFIKNDCDLTQNFIPPLTRKFYTMYRKAYDNI